MTHQCSRQAAQSFQRAGFEHSRHAEPRSAMPAGITRQNE
jgi:hypothetical protein